MFNKAHQLIIFHQIIAQYVTPTPKEINFYLYVNMSSQKCYAVSIFVCTDVFKNVEQIEADICEICLILLRTCREFTSFNSDFHFFPEKQEVKYSKFTGATKGTVLKELIKK